MLSWHRSHSQIVLVIMLVLVLDSFLNGKDQADRLISSLHCGSLRIKATISLLA
jgi:hypothetical protein